ncbi:MAG: efflux RND transporter periplasmic adaptor subunit [Pseudomonadota bacterium]
MSPNKPKRTDEPPKKGSHDPLRRRSTGAADQDYVRPKLKQGVAPAPGPVGNPVKGSQARGAGGPRVSLRNPDTGRTIQLSASEMQLVTLADGQRDLEMLHSLQAGEDALDLKAVKALFQRLSIMKFLDSGAEPAPDTASGTSRRVSQAKTRARAAPSPVETAKQDTPATGTKPNRPAASAIPSARRTSQKTGEMTPLAPRAKKPAEVKQPAAEAKKPPVAQKPVDEAAGRGEAQQDKGPSLPKTAASPAVPQKAPAAPPKAAAAPSAKAPIAAVENATSEPAETPASKRAKAGSSAGASARKKRLSGSEPEAEPKSTPASAPQSEPKSEVKPRSKARAATSSPRPLLLEQKDTGAKRASDPSPDDDPFDTITAHLTPATKLSDLDDDDLDDLDLDAELGFGGGLGAARGENGRMGGERLRAIMAARQGGGMGGGLAGAMGGGMGPMAGMAGGMGAGMAGGMAGGMGGGGMGGARAAMAMQQPPEDEGPIRLRLFDPTWLLRLLYVFGYPLKFFFWALVPLVVIAGMTLIQNWSALFTDLKELSSQISRLWLVIVGAGLVNLISRLAQGVAIQVHGGAVSALGLKVMFGVIPRFYIDTQAVRQLDRTGQLWAAAAPLMARIGIFAVGALLWAITRESGTGLSSISLIAAQIGLIVFVITAFPLFPAEGQRWLAVYLGDPQLLPRTIAVMRHRLFGAPMPARMQSGPTGNYFLFGLAVIISMAAGIGTLAAFTALTLEAELGGTGVMIFLGLVVAFVFWLLSVKAMISRRFKGAGGGAAAGDMAADMADGPQPHLMEAVTDSPARTGSRGAARVVWAVILTALLAVAFLPYDYQAGGRVEILPAARAQAVARTNGEVIELFVSDGSIVAQGDPLAQLSNWEQINARNLTQVQLIEAEARLARLEAGAKPEEIAVAETQLENAQAALTFSKGELDRRSELLARGAVPARDVERAQADYQANLNALATAEANLALIKSGATLEDLTIARANVEQLTLDLAFREAEIARTRIVAPMSGRVVTPELQLRIGSYLNVGSTLLEIERSDVVSAAIAVPESDITLVEPGDQVTLKIRGLAGQPIEGTVARIATVANDDAFGRIVRVEAEVENADDILRSGMTGYAKVEGAEMRVWEAYLRSIQRFFQIEFWSWIP